MLKITSNNCVNQMLLTNNSNYAPPLIYRGSHFINARNIAAESV